MNVLYYWRPDNYLKDRRFGFGYHLNQNSPVLAQVARGESIWAFTRDRFGRYALAAEIVARAVTRNPASFRYGRHRVWGDLERTRYFDIDASPGAETLIRHLRITARAATLAQSFQGHRAVKPLAESDALILRDFAQSLPVLEIAGIYPEDEFEARLVLGHSARSMLVRETPAEQSARVRYLLATIDVVRSRANVLWLQHTYEGRCQLCGWDPRDIYGHPLCHGHHIHWLSRGGVDDLDNMVLICPNHHAAVHHADAVFDYESKAFEFSNGSCEYLQLDRHLPAAA